MGLSHWFFALALLFLALAGGGCILYGGFWIIQAMLQGQEIPGDAISVFLLGILFLLLCIAGLRRF
ncbi:hypothetical protein HYW55_06705 [Candidatus Gottesmanbacteria bacterium]|nr:hypothetical protein [Candidatus Gottesmanbacteria bacterium]